MSITLEFIQAEITAQTYEISMHADDERLADHLTIAQVEDVLDVMRNNELSHGNRGNCTLNPYSA